MRNRISPETGLIIRRTRSGGKHAADVKRDKQLRNEAERMDRGKEEAPIQEQFTPVLDSVLFHSELNPKDMMFISYVLNLSRQKGFCYASSAHLAETFKVAECTIRRWLQKLQKLKLIVVKIVPHPSRSELLSREIYPIPALLESIGVTRSALPGDYVFPYKQLEQGETYKEFLIKSKIAWKKAKKKTAAYKKKRREKKFTRSISATYVEESLPLGENAHIIDCSQQTQPFKTPDGVLKEQVNSSSVSSEIKSGGNMSSMDTAIAEPSSTTVHNTLTVIHPSKLLVARNMELASAQGDMIAHTATLNFRSPRQRALALQVLAREMPETPVAVLELSDPGTGGQSVIRNDYARYWQRRVVAEEILAQPEAQRPKQLPGTTVRGRGGLQRWVAKSPLAAKIVEFLFEFTEVEHMGEFDWYFWKKIYGAVRRGHISEERMKLFDKVGVERKVFLLEDSNKALEYFLRQFEKTGAIGQEIEELTQQLHVRTNSLMHVNTEKLAEGIKYIDFYKARGKHIVFEGKLSYSTILGCLAMPSEDQAHLDGYWYLVFCLMAGLFRHLQMNHTDENRQALSAFIETIPPGRRLQLQMYVARHRWVQLLLVREMPTFSNWFFDQSMDEFFVWAEGYWSHARHELLEQAKALNITKIIPMEPPVVKIDEDAERAFRTALAA